MEHVKTQNWTAVVLDFVIVVVGVFIGIQVANWNEGMHNQQRAANYRDRLVQEMTLNRLNLESRQASYQSQINNGLQALGAKSRPSNREEAWVIIRAFFQASHAFAITLQRGTYDEIISSGDLALLGDQELVNGLSAFYTFGGFATIEIIPRYRENVRRLIPFSLQRYFQTQCYQIVNPDQHFLLDCLPPADAQDLIALAAELQADNELKRDLQYMLSFAGVSADIAKNRTATADEVLAILAKS